MEKQKHRMKIGIQHSTLMSQCSLLSDALISGYETYQRWNGNVALQQQEMLALHLYHANVIV